MVSSFLVGCGPHLAHIFLICQKVIKNLFIYRGNRLHKANISRNPGIKRKKTARHTQKLHAASRSFEHK